MERESLLAILIVVLGGLVLQVFAACPGRFGQQSTVRRRERILWLVIWWPVAPALTVAAWLCGWALSQPDPVPHRVGRLLFVAAGAFAILCIRALVRAVWSLCRSAHFYGIVTVGLLRPRIVVAQELALVLDERAMQAALTHEQMHARHYDPMRIWLAQFVTDLQWPWAPAQRRFDAWLEALELARDDEARAAGVAGADLAAAVIGSARFQLGMAAATLTGRSEALPARIARLLRPLPDHPASPELPYVALAGGLAIIWMVAIVLGLWFGERLVSFLLAIS